LYPTILGVNSAYKYEIYHILLQNKNRYLYQNLLADKNNNREIN